MLTTQPRTPLIKENGQTPIGRRAPEAGSLSRLLLLCGAIAGPLFICTVLLQDYTRPGFDPRVHLLSQLSLGDWGWIQITNFVAAGVLNLAYAIGLWRTLHPGRAGTWGPVLIAGYGLGLVTVGLFTTDPANGFPPGVVTPTGPSLHGVVHALGALLVFILLSAAIGVFVRYFVERQQRWSAAYCLSSAVVMLVIFFAGFINPASMALTLRLAMFLGWLAASVTAMRLLSVPGVGNSGGPSSRDGSRSIGCAQRTPDSSGVDA